MPRVEQEPSPLLLNLIQIPKITYILQALITERYQPSLDRDRALEVLKILLAEPAENAYRIALFFNFVGGDEKLRSDSLEIMSQYVQWTMVKPYKWKQIFPVGINVRGKGKMFINCVSSEPRIKEEITTEGMQVPSLFLVDTNDQPIAVIKSHKGDLLVLGMEWSVTKEGSVIAPGVWYYPWIKEGNNLVFRGRVALGRSSVFFWPARPWNGSRRKLKSNVPIHTRMERGNLDGPRDLEEFNEVAAALRNKFLSGVVEFL